MVPARGGGDGPDRDAQHRPLGGADRVPVADRILAGAGALERSRPNRVHLEVSLRGAAVHQGPAVTPPLVFVVAGEPSGDQIGGRLMAMLREKRPDIAFAGIGGPRMQAEGLATLFPMEELSLVGLTSVIPHIPGLLRRMGETARRIRALRPRVVLFIDASGFARGVARRLKGSGIPIVQYKAPQVWAYWPWRARKMARYFDRLLVILPFEPRFFARYGARATFIGHPATESDAAKGDGAAFRARHAIGPGELLLCVLPGSRRSEIAWALPIFAAALGLLRASMPGLRVVVPTIEPVAATVRAAAERWPGSAIVVEGDAERFGAMAASDAALAVSGTVSVELALAGVPMVVTYRGNWLSYLAVLLMAQARYATIVNLVLDRPVVDERLQTECRPDRLAEACRRLLDDPGRRAAQTQAYAEAVAQLDAGLAPTRRAAEVVLEYLKD
ncbi:MAG: lipid-A-disaccharide synthase [Alphaproteobacteria bacterium]|nr:lipid-A-disaccharide synthase [Alphaproteobacteria bacterium]